MSKDDGSTGIKSISGSQRAKAAKAAKAAKSGESIVHGGTCSACGEISSSCTTGNEHQHCAGFFKGTFLPEKYMALAILQRRYQSQEHSHRFVMLVDGTLIRHEEIASGRWIPSVEISQQRDARETEGMLLLSRECHVIVLRSAGEWAATFFNGLGQPLSWFDNAWKLTDSLTDEELRWVETDRAQRKAWEAVTEQVAMDVEIVPTADDLFLAAEEAAEGHSEGPYDSYEKLLPNLLTVHLSWLDNAAAPTT